MTPLQIEAMARNKYNATGDSFYSSAEIRSYVWQAQMELAIAAHCIERVYATVSVASQQQYDWPTFALGIKRVTYAGQKLQQISFREDDSLTLSNSSTTATGTPSYYSVWNKTIYLRPIPAASSEAIQIFTYNEPQEVTSDTSVLEVDTTHHMAIVDFVTAQLALKDQNIQIAEYYLEKWEDYKKKAIAHQRKMKRGDKFTHVQDVDTLPETVLGLT